MEWWAPEFHWLYPQTCNMARNTPITPTRSHLLPPMGPSSHHISQTNPRTRMIRGDKCSAILPDQGRDQQYHVTVLSCSVRPWNCHTRLTAPAIDYQTKEGINSIMSLYCPAQCVHGIVIPGSRHLPLITRPRKGSTVSCHCIVLLSASMELSYPAHGTCH